MTEQFTEWKEISPNERMRVNYGLHQIGEQEPYITVTAEIEEKRGNRWVDSSFGTMPKEIAKHFPEFKELMRWHLVSPEAPMHYLANGQYWWEHILGTGKFELRSYDADPVEAFKSTILYGVLPTDEEELVLPKGAGRGKRPSEEPTLYGEEDVLDIRPWLEQRLPRIQQDFRDVVEQYDLKVFRTKKLKSVADGDVRGLKNKLLK